MKISIFNSLALALGIVLVLNAMNVSGQVIIGTGLIYGSILNIIDSNYKKSNTLK